MDIQKIVRQMTLEEKAGLCAGRDAWHTMPIDRLGVPAIMMADGPNGLRKEIEGGRGDILRDSYPSTCFPTASALASSWNRSLIRRIGNAIAEECLAEKVSAVLGPGANIKRSPLCGRNFEYFSEDPFITGEIAAAFICGVQEKGVGTSLKHFAVNNQEYRRMLIDVVVDERTLREIYLAGFETAVKLGKPWTMMAAYNRVNGAYCTENERLLDQVLRIEWGFDGIVVSDWGAVNDRVGGIQAGLDLEMPGIPNGNRELIINAVQCGTLSIEALDAVVHRLLQFVARCKANLVEKYETDLEAHHTLAEQAAAEGAVLLKNLDNMLPLKREMKVALIGKFAKYPRFQGSGSSLIHPVRLDNLYDAMIEYAGEENIPYADGYGWDPQEDENVLLMEAIDVAKEADAVVVCAGLPEMEEVESLDRHHLRLPESHDRLIEAVVKANPKTAVLLSNGSPVEMPWISHVPAVLEGYLGGQAGASAYCKLIFGEMNPSGKLAETFPVSQADVPCNAYFPGGPKTVEYRESIFVGYRFYDTVKKDVLFPFGHGLSYTSFEYSNLNLPKTMSREADHIDVSFSIENTGPIEGMESAQVYVRPLVSSVFRPDKELKGFAKIDLLPGEKKEIKIQLVHRAFAFYSTRKSDWVVEAGEYEILVGASSRDIRLAATLHVEGESLKTEENSEKNAFYEVFPRDARVPKADFETVLGHKAPANNSNPRSFTLNTPIIDMQGSLIGRILQKVIRKQIDNLGSQDMHGPTRLMIEQMALESPLRLLVMFSGGAFNRKTLEGLLSIANGRIFSGITIFLGSLRRKRNI